MNKILTLLFGATLAFAADTVFKTEVLRFGKPSTGVKTLMFARTTSETVQPGVRWNEATSTMQFSHDGTTWTSFGAQVTGTIVMWPGGATCPTGTVELDGSSQLRAGAYAGIFALTSTTYGAVDGTHFNLPNGRGVFIRGAGSQTIGAVSYTGTPGSSENDAMPSHRHRPWGQNSGGALTTIGNGSSRGMAGIAGGGGDGYYDTAPATGHQYLENTGSGSETKPGNITLKYCITL